MPETPREKPPLQPKTFRSTTEAGGAHADQSWRAPTPWHSKQTQEHQIAETEAIHKALADIPELAATPGNESLTNRERLLTELTKAVRESAVLTFPVEEYSNWQLGFGINNSLENKRLTFDLTRSKDNFSFWGKLSMQPPVKRLIYHQQLPKERIQGGGPLLVAHYPISEKNAALLAKTEDRHEPKVPDGFGTKSFYERLNGLKGISCIETNLFHMSIMLGRQDLMQKVVDFFKENPDNTLDLMNSILGDAKGIIATDTRDTTKIDIYDLLGRPKEAHLTVEPRPLKPQTSSESE